MVITKLRIKFFVAFFGVFILISSFVFAYSPYYTHPDLTEEIAKLHNLKNENADLEISQKEIDWMRDGAINEDKPPRWINHFYDPIHQSGWSGKHFGTLTQEEGQYEGASMAPRPVLASIDWVTNQEYQAAYGRQYGNQTWQKAIKLYIDGDKKSAFIALGHILHLIEDASVPDHTRDDTHADLYGDPGSPYESYSKEYTNANQDRLNIAENLKNKEFLNFSTIQDAFNHLANYSNNNFFSEDTISNEEFEIPDLGKVEKKIKNINNKKILFLYDSQKQIYLAILNDDEKYSTNNKSFILPSYFSNLSREAVLTGGSVLKLFFQEVEKYKNNPELLPEIISDTNEGTLSYLKKSPRLAAVNAADAYDKISTDTKIYTAAISQSFIPYYSANISQPIIQFDSWLNNYQSQIQSVINQNQASLTTSPTIALQLALSEEVNSPQTATLTPQNANTSNPPPTPSRPQPIPAPIRPPQPPAQNNKQNNQNNAVPWPGFVFAPPLAVDSGNQENIAEDLTPPAIPTITTSNGQDFTTSTAEIILEGGKAEDAEEILINDSVENVVYPAITFWEKSVILTEGENIFEVKAKDGAGNISAAASIKITLKFPSPKFYLTNYEVRELNFTLNWEDENNIATDWELQYRFGENFEWQNIAIAQNDSRYNFTAQYDDTVYYFRLRGQDKNGNFTDWIDLQAEISTKPVVINEIAWMGTRGPSSDEWIELYNKTNSDIDLTDWILEAPDGSPKIEFNKNDKDGNNDNDKDGDKADLKTPIIKAKSYFLLERTDDDATSEEADWFFTGALDNAKYSKSDEERSQNEGLVLKENEIIIDKVSVWYAGDNDKKTSMERISSSRGGDDPDNWKNNDEMTFNGKDADDNDILGTPKQKNSVVKIIDGVYGRDVNFYGFPDVAYLVKSFKLESGFVLTVSPGAVVKFNAWTEDDPALGSMAIYGALIAKGTAENKIYFTSERDDSVGGDTNGDGEATLAEQNDWDALRFYDSSKGSQLEYVDIKYAYSAIELNANDLNVANSSISFSENAVYSYGGDLSVAQNVFSDISNYGIYTERGKLVLKDNNFNNNYQPLYIDFKTELENSGNSVSDNVYNGVILYGDAENSGRLVFDSDKILRKDIPYVILESVEINEDAALTIEKGTIIKLFGENTRIDVFGKLIAEGSAEEKIIFTSLSDDLSGGSRLRHRKWGGISFYSTAENSVLKNVKITNSEDGIYLGSLANFSLENIEISEGEQGITVYGSAFYLRNSRISDTSDGALIVFGGSIANVELLVIDNVISDEAIVVFAASVLILKDSTIQNIKDGDALVAFENASIEIVDSVFKDGTGDGLGIFDGSDLSVKNSSIENFSGSGIIVFVESTVVVENSEIKNNGYGINAFDSSVSISGSVVSNNALYGIYNETEEVKDAAIVNAENNWWGDTSGPAHLDLNPEGQGDKVSDNVNFEPWLEVNPNDDGGE